MMGLSPLMRNCAKCSALQKEAQSPGVDCDGTGEDGQAAFVQSAYSCAPTPSPHFAKYVESWGWRFCRGKIRLPKELDLEFLVGSGLARLSAVWFSKNE
jgi:hypothetical protein